MWSLLPRRKRRAPDCRQPRPIPELPYLIEWSHRMAPLEPCGGRHMHVACWPNAHIWRSPCTKKPPRKVAVENETTKSWEDCRAL